MIKVFDQNKIGQLIAKGAHYEVREYGKDKVVKIPLSGAIRYTGPLQTEKHYSILKRYLGIYLPQTKFIHKKEHKQPLVIQEKIEGRSLRDVKWKEIKKSKELSKNLLELIKGIIKLEKETGKVVEMFGEGKLWWRAHPKDTDNIIIDKKGKPFLVDVFLIDPGLKGIKIGLWRKARRNWIIWLLKRSLKKMEKDLENLSR